jgi:YD repeat-containing protein
MRSVAWPRITDANGGVTSHGYDVFGRLVQRTTPDGGTATAAFANWGNPNTQYVQTAIADGTADGLWTRTYLDGLGSHGARSSTKADSRPTASTALRGLLDRSTARRT